MFQFLGICVFPSVVLNGVSPRCSPLFHTTLFPSTFSNLCLLAAWPSLPLKKTLDLFHTDFTPYILTMLSPHFCFYCCCCCLGGKQLPPFPSFQVVFLFRLFLEFISTWDYLWRSSTHSQWISFKNTACRHCERHEGLSPAHCTWLQLPLSCAPSRGHGQ